ncbi:MAG TPA: hypothetical protein DEH22_01415 [Chloroflexi bacterium]|nr:hypothetical protein [Chloroflexota bacterium]
MVRPKRKLWAGLAITLLLLVISGCSVIGNILPAAQPSATATSTITVTPSFTPSPSNTPTQTLTPTVPGLATATVKPTLRPSWTPIPTNTWRPTWTASPTLSPTATSPVELVLTETFDDPLNPWLDKKGDNWAVGNAGKKYFMSVYEPKVEITSARTWLKLDEVRIEADITHNNGSGYYGFNCRESPGGNYYTIFITTDGYYGFGENRNEKLTVLESHKLPVLDPPIDPKGTNHVRADCRGNALTLYINDVAIDRTTVPGLGYGYVGMMIGTRSDDERLTVYFDNLMIWKAFKEE